MGSKTLQVSKLAAVLVFVMGCAAFAQPQWTNLANAAPGHLDTCLLLTNGDVMCHEYQTNKWHRLRPNNFGSYVNGTWDSPAIANMPNGHDTSGLCPTTCPYAPLYFGSAVLSTGRVVVVGGEYNNYGAGLQSTWTNMGFSYNPVANTWSSQLTVPFATGSVGDAQTTVLQNGTLLLARITDGNIASFNPSTNTFTALNPTGKVQRNDEEGWTQLPSGRVLAVVAKSTTGQYQLYDSGLNQWLAAGSTAGVLLGDFGSGSCASQEVGPAVARPDGTVVNFSGHKLGQNAVYNMATDTWSHPGSIDFPAPGGTQFTAADAPASLLPDGHVLVQASPFDSSCNFSTPSHFYEWDGSTLTPVVDAANAASFTSYQGRMLLLPSGEILYTAFNQDTGSPVDTVQIYSNGGTPLGAWRPVITSVPSTLVLNTTYTVNGQQFNGFSEGSGYGDDAQSSTNFPLVRVVNNSTGHVFYLRTHDHSRMGVKFVGDTTPDSTQFDVPGSGAIEQGASKLYVVTNGIPSLSYDVTVTVNHPPVAIAKNIVVDADASCTASVAAAQVDNGSYDPDGDSITLSLVPPGPFPVGVNNVQLKVTDSHGASSFASATITVRRYNRINVNASTTQVGKRVTIKLTASVTSTCGSGPYTGTITFNYSGSPFNGSVVVPISASGTASYTFPTVNTPVILNYQAVYSGDGGNVGATSNVKSVQVF